MTKFWKNLAHLALLGANGYVAAKYPSLAPVLGPIFAAGNAALASPLASQQLPPAK